MRSIGLILLAAGGSTRLGSPKQLLSFRGKTFIKSAAETALAAFYGPVVVVLGANAGLAAAELIGLRVKTVLNPDWKTGLGSSLCRGLEGLLRIEEQEERATGSVLVMLCDQPFVSVELLQDLARAQLTSRRPIIACRYNQTLGVPALFSREFYPELLSLQPQEGAKRIIERHWEKVQPLDFPQGAADVDTREDYEQILTAG